MLIPNQESELFLNLHNHLLFFAYAKSDKTPTIKNYKDFLKSSFEVKLEARDHLMVNLDLIDDYISENPNKHIKDELLQIQCWKNAKVGDFIIERNLKSHSIFLDAENQSKAYGVLGLKTEFSELLPFFPIWITAVLLPWDDQILCDGMFIYKPMHFGAGIRAGFKDQYTKAKRKGIITTLEFEKDSNIQLQMKNKVKNPKKKKQ